MAGIQIPGLSNLTHVSMVLPLQHVRI